MKLLQMLKILPILLIQLLLTLKLLNHVHNLWFLIQQMLNFFFLLLPLLHTLINLIDFHFLYLGVTHFLHVLDFLRYLIQFLDVLTLLHHLLGYYLRLLWEALLLEELGIWKWWWWRLWESWGCSLWGLGWWGLVKGWWFGWLGLSWWELSWELSLWSEICRRCLILCCLKWLFNLHSRVSKMYLRTWQLTPLYLHSFLHHLLPLLLLLITNKSSLLKLFRLTLNLLVTWMPHLRYWRLYYNLRLRLRINWSLSGLSRKVRLD